MILGAVIGPTRSKNSLPSTKTLSQKENVNMSLPYLVAVGSAILAVIFIAVSAFLIWYYFYMTKKRNEGGRMGFTQTKGTVSAETDENGDLTWGD